MLYKYFEDDRYLSTCLWEDFKCNAITYLMLLISNPRIITCIYFFLEKQVVCARSYDACVNLFLVATYFMGNKTLLYLVIIFLYNAPSYSSRESCDR